ncbi:hypothetical protein HDV00_011216 [Rhizophlyctis rosea]|nr:hypothetical protein HDV00_011216 [Rhizophlyctis rosea]
MWAGGRFEWTPNNPLRTGQEISQHVSVDNISKKTGKSGIEVAYVSLKMDIMNKNGLSLREKRSYAYISTETPISTTPLEAKPSGKTDTSSTLQSASPPPSFRTPFIPTEIDLFRYSALTFNSHLIHYSHPYATQTEQYPNLVVHGPLMATVLLKVLGMHARVPSSVTVDYDELQWQIGLGEKIRWFEYRARKPLFVGERVLVCGVWVDDGGDGGGAGVGAERRCKLWAENERGDVCMRADAGIGV